MRLDSRTIEVTKSCELRRRGFVGLEDPREQKEFYMRRMEQKAWCGGKFLTELRVTILFTVFTVKILLTVLTVKIMLILLTL